MYRTESFLEPEVIDGFEVTAKRKKIWQIEIDLLQEFDKFCREKNIHYSVAGGTLLGAIRHKGFIPWDDDIDVFVFREDYERLIRIAPDYFQGKYHFQSYINEKHYDRPHAQLRNSETTAILESEIKNKKTFNQGIFIDIFPLDVWPKDNKKQKELLQRVIKQKRIIDGFVRYNQFANHSFFGVLKHFILKIVGLKKMIKHYSKICSKYSNDESSLVSDFSFWLDRANIWGKNLWEEKTYYQFEYIKVPGPRNYGCVLKEQYGEYEKHIIGKSEHGEVFFDTERPYTYYLNEGEKELEQYAATKH